MKGKSPAEINRKTKEELKKGAYVDANATNAGEGVSASEYRIRRCAGGRYQSNDLTRQKGVQSNFQ